MFACWYAALQQCLNLEELLVCHVLFVQAINRDCTHAAPCIITCVAFVNIIYKHV